MLRLPRLARVAAVAGLAAAGAGLLAGCGGGAIGQNDPASNGKSFVSGSYATTVYPANDAVSVCALFPGISGRSTLRIREVGVGPQLALSGCRSKTVSYGLWFRSRRRGSR